MRVDPLADAPANIGTSPYTYVWNNPLKFIDPDGRHGTSHHLDEDGNVIGSLDDDDKRTYVHKTGTTLDQIKGYNKETGQTSGGGSLLGSKGQYQLKWSPNRNYRGGDPSDPLHANSRFAISPEEFESKYGNTDVSNISYDGTALLDSKSGGPSPRYVTDPKTGYVIDMRHFIKVGQRGELFGDYGEFSQRNEWPNSAYHPQDLFSNKLGVKFFSEHIKYTTFFNALGPHKMPTGYNFPGGFAKAFNVWLNNR